MRPGSKPSVKKPVLRGRETPRLATEPLRRLTRKTSLGYEVIDFAEQILQVDLLPWQKWWLIHALELDTNGGFRYRTIVTLVARQNGKTTLLKILTVALMYLSRVKMVLGSAQSLDIAREAWAGAVDLAEGDPELRAEVESIRRTNGEQEFRLTNGARYKISASSRSAGRGLSVDLLILDELREHRTWDAWGALSKTTIARPNALIVGISNAGDDESTVLNSLRDRAMSDEDPSIGIFEWSAPEDCDLDDREGWAQANPGLGYTISEAAIASARATDPPAVFRTEVLCQRVDSLNGAFDLAAWRACLDPAGSLAELRDKVVFCVDVAPDGAHVTVAAAAEHKGYVRVEIVAAWETTEQARNGLSDLLSRTKPLDLAWFPGGPAAALGPLMREHNAVEVKGLQVAEAAQSFVDLVRSRKILHPGDPLLDAHVAGAVKLPSGDGFRFARGGTGHVDAVYAVAGAVQVALTREEEPPMPRPMVV